MGLVLKEGHAKRVEFSSAVKKTARSTCPRSSELWRGRGSGRTKECGSGKLSQNTGLHKRMTWDVANVEICYSLSYSDLTDGASPIIVVCEGLGLRMHNLRSDVIEFCGPRFVTLKCHEQDAILIFCFVLFVWGRV